MDSGVPLLAVPHRRRRWNLTRHTGAMVGASVLMLLLVVALGAPWIAPRTPLEQDINQRLMPPSREFPLGSDHLGRDILSRLVYGSRVSLLVGLSAVILGGVMGSTLGMVGGYFGGGIDRTVTSLTDTFLSFPTLLLALVFIATLGSGVANVILAVGLSVWPGVARVIRGEIIKLRQREFVEAARVIGASDGYVLWRHLLPNALGPLLVVLTFDVGTVILAEASLGFLGLGIPPPAPTWGRIVSEGRGYLRIAPWAMVFGGTAISLTVLALNLVGDGLRDMLDPTLQRTS